MIKRKGAYTLCFENMPTITGYASVVGKKESEGPLGNLFDKVIEDSRAGCDTYEEAESSFQRQAASLAMEKSGQSPEGINCAFAGDLLNQCISSSFGLMEFGIPFLGQYGACSTMAQSLIMATVFVESGAAQNALCTTSSHFCSAERQYRFPMEYGSVRTPTAQWTVTGAGSCVLGSAGKGAAVAAATVGTIIDLKVTDANNMGAAMAPAAAETISRFLEDTGTVPEDYDRIFTGDLGRVGSDVLYDLLLQRGYDIRNRHDDCGLLIFDREAQDVHAGGSGCGCCASVLCSKILGDMASGILNNILFIATGALLSTTSSQQGKSIPSIAHLVNLRNR